MFVFILKFKNFFYQLSNNSFISWINLGHGITFYCVCILLFQVLKKEMVIKF